MERNYKVTTRHRVAERIWGGQIASHRTPEMRILPQLCLGHSFETKLDLDE
jgi:hypothetical protein